MRSRTPRVTSCNRSSRAGGRGIAKPRPPKRKPGRRNDLEPEHPWLDAGGTRADGTKEGIRSLRTALAAARRTGRSLLVSERTNRLIDETSPYLRQHAHNPVDWYPWGAEAFARARGENKPIML